MNFDIRGAVIHNIHNMNEEELQELVVDSIQQREEKLLPGLGFYLKSSGKTARKKNARK